MLEGGDEGHVMNTSSGNGGIAPLATTAIYATTKAAVTTVTEVLYGQLRAVDSRIGVSVLFPGPKVLRTGLLDSSSKRPERMGQRHSPDHAVHDDRVVRGPAARRRDRARLHAGRVRRRGGRDRDP